MKLIIIIIINIEKKKNLQNLKWATAHLSRRLGAGARRRGRWGAGLGAGCWARGRVAGGWARAGSGMTRALQATGARACGAGGGRVRGARQAGRRRWARGLGAGHAAWAPGLALGSALGALGPFSIRFDSFFS